MYKSGGLKYPTPTSIDAIRTECLGVKLCTITPTRGDRQNLLLFCLGSIKKMNGGNMDSAFLVRFQPKNDEVDLVTRVKHGIGEAKNNGYDFAFIIEDDDWYPGNYLTAFGDLSNYDFVGFSSTTYYNIRNRTYETLKHKDRSSLFCTGFRISALDSFNWPNDNAKFLDIALWEYANRSNKRIKLLEDNPCLGIKHGIGKCAGKGHVMHLKNQDNNLQFLKGYVDQESFEFYTKLMETL